MPTDAIGIAIDQLLALDRCELCGFVASPDHGVGGCRTARGRAALWADGFVDLHWIWPQANAEAAEHWPEKRRGPGWAPVYDGLGLATVSVVDTPWVRDADANDTLLAVAACNGLHALRPGRGPDTVARQVAAMGAAGRRSLAAPNGVEIPVRCGERHHRIAVLDGHLLPRDHPDEWKDRRPKHRHVVNPTGWEVSLATTGLPLLLQGVSVAADPAGPSCAAVVDAWATGIRSTARLDLTKDGAPWAIPSRLQAPGAALALLEATSRAALIARLLAVTGGDVTANLVVELGAPGSATGVARHRHRPAVLVNLPVDGVSAAAAWQPTG